MNIVVYEKRSSEAIDDFSKAVTDTELRYYASSLIELGIGSMDEIHGAIGRAMQICNALHVPARSHFKVIYLYKNGTLITDWRLSEMARKLILLNADPANPVVAKIQLRLLNGL